MQPIVSELKPTGNVMLKTKAIHDIIHSNRINIATMSLYMLFMFIYIFTINANPLNQSYSQNSQQSSDYLYRIVCYYEEIIKEFLAISLNTRRLIN
ncbi:hypothetical protein T01_1965 [Trichinella spiralis]|uniref:Uncharacterized protein n=1 Tax=Trichinella spiralis TaxID=6334 RepID=A0A0V1BJL7_TRISP|nr:hypothetical protein T01_1965 [Trichinella spiralis]